MNKFPFDIPTGPIFGKTVAVAGALEHFPGVLAENKGFCRLLERYGGKLCPSVSADTACLVCNDPTAHPAAIQEAQTLQIPVLSEREFLDWLCLGCGVSKAADFTIEDGLLVRYNGDDPDVIIPPEVHTIGDAAFRNCSKIRSVSIGQNVTAIGEEAFSSCHNLQGIRIPSLVRSIGPKAFYRCFGLLYLILPEGLHTIGDSAFHHASQLQTLVIPSTVADIGNEAFSTCSRLISLTIQPGVRRIGCSAFSSCIRLTSLTLPAGTVLNSGAFSYCEGLEALVLPPDLLTIANSLLIGCNSLTSLVLPPSVKTIGINSFADCLNLSHIVLPQGLTSIGNAAFSGCGLETLCIPNTVTFIGPQAFRSSNLRRICIPEGVTTIGNQAFWGCTALETVTLPQSLIILEEHAFHHCHRLQPIAFPESLGRISDDVYYGCQSMANADGLLIVGTRLISAFLEGRTQLVIPEGITSVRSSALFDADDLEAVTVPAGVTDLGDHFLDRLPELRSVILPPEITHLEHHTLIHCNQLQLLQAPGLPEELLQSKHLIYPAAMGYLCNPAAYTQPETRAFYEKTVRRLLGDLLVDVFQQDRVAALSTCAATGLITRQNFHTHYLQPALAANATGCVFFLMEWKHCNLPPEKDPAWPAAWDDDVFNEADMLRLWRVAKVPDGFMIMSYRGQEDTVLVPPRIGETPVLGIGPFALSPRNKIFPKARPVLSLLKEVRIMPGITEIRPYAFQSCPLLERVFLPDTLMSVGGGAFDECPLLTIHAPAGSFAEAYAKEKHIPFVAE